MDLINQLKKQKDILTTWFNRLISLPIQFIIMPMTMSYLGIESYAFYLVLNGLINWFYMCDFSFGLILQNMIGEYQNDKQKLNQVVSYSFIIMCILLIGWSILILLLSPIISNLLLKNYFINNTALKSLAFILISILALINSLFTNTITKIYYSFGNGWQINLLSGILSIVTFIITLFVYKYINTNKLLWVIIINNSPNLIFIFHYIYMKNKYNQKFDIEQFKNFIIQLIHRSKFFFLNVIVSALILQVDYIIISLYADNKAVIQYNFINKIFNISWTMFGAILISYYPILVKNTIDKSWCNIKTTVKKIIFLGLTGYVFIFLSIILLKEFISQYFFKNLIFIPNSLIILFMLYSFCRVWSDTLAFILSALELAKQLLLILIIQSIISLSLQLLLIKQLGVNAILIGLIISYLITMIWYIPYLLYKKLRIKNGS